jgi:hypothetical protein
LMVIKHGGSTKNVAPPSDPADRAMQTKVEEELSSVYLQGRPGYRLAVADAQHMTFSDMAVLEPWADVGRRLGVEDATMVRELWLRFASIFEHSLTSFCLVKQ